MSAALRGRAPRPLAFLHGALTGLDLGLAALALCLGLVGVAVALSTSPGEAGVFSGPMAFALAVRQAVYVAGGCVVAFVLSQLDERGVRRFGVVLALGALLLTIVVAAFAPEVRGAARWFDFGFFSFQPSELLKPGLVIFWAWMFSEAKGDARFPGLAISGFVLAVSAAALLAQPDVGQTALLGVVFLALVMVLGVRLRWILLGLGAMAAFGAAAYASFGHVRDRVAGLLNPDSDAGRQVSRALEAISGGGVIGRGPGEGVIKRILPDAHADFVFAVIAEEFGLLGSLLLIGLFGWIAWKVFRRAARLSSPFAQMAAAGLGALLVAQAGVHIAVNLGLAPAKGMTLPFVSYGGSSMLGSAIAMGFLLALTRERPGAAA